MRRVVRGSLVSDCQPSTRAQLLEAEVVVDPREIGAAHGAVLVEQEARAVDRAVVVARDGAVQVLEGLDRAIGVCRRIAS